MQGVECSFILVFPWELEKQVLLFLQWHYVCSPSLVASVLDSSQVSLYLRSNLTQVKAHVTAEQERDTGKDGMGSFQGVSVSHHHCLVILGGRLDPQWSIRRYFCYPYGNNFSEPDYACFFEKLSYHQRPMCSQREFGGP